MNLPMTHCFLLAAALFAIGVAGFLTRRNTIAVLMSIELMLNAVNLTFLAAARRHAMLASGDASADLAAIMAHGSVMGLFVIAVAACEAAVGLALVISLFRHMRTADLSAAAELRG